MDDAARCEWIMLQLTDTNFPAGSLGNSNGLESAVNHNVVTSGSARSLFEFVVLVLEQNAGQMLPFLRAAYRAVQKRGEGEDGVLIEVDSICHTNMSNEASIRSSITQGRCFLKACEASFGQGVYTALVDAVSPPKKAKGGDGREDGELERVVACFHRCLDGHGSGNSKRIMQGHYPVVFGALVAALGLPLPMACRAFMRCVLRDVCSCATRLNIVGPLEGANIQAKLSSVVEEMISSSTSSPSQSQPQSEGRQSEVDEDDIFGTPQLQGLFSELPTTSSPMVDMVQSRHDLLYSRLFNS